LSQFHRAITRNKSEHINICLRMAFTAGGRFPRARLEPPRSPKPLTAGSQDSCCSRRSRRLTLQP